MTLIVDVPPGRAAERAYVLGVLLGERLGQDWRLRVTERADVRITVDGAPGPAVILPDVLFGADGPGWLTPASLPRPPLRTVELPDGEPIPVLFGHPAPRAAPDTAAGRPEPAPVRLDVDLLGGAFFLLSRYEEVVLPDRDEHDRFPAAASLAHRAGFLDRPLVDAYTELLWAALSRCWPRLHRPQTSYRVLLTHDVDDPLSVLGRRPADLARQLAADLVHRRDPGLAGRRVGALLLDRRPAHARDPHNTFDFLLEVSERAGLTSAFYLQSHAAADHVAGAHYAIDHPFITDLLRRVHQRGHEIGYHAGFGTHRDPRRTAAEFHRLRAAAEAVGVRQPCWGGRQHYLQWAAPQTWRNWAEAGLAYDCSVAFADAVGFRTGTCHEFPVFDLLAGRPLALRERPFQIMDVTLFGYQGLSAATAHKAVLRIAGQCRRYRGSLGVLWHNDSHLRTARERRWYAELVTAVTS